MGHTRATSGDVAAQAHVSRTTVSFVLNRPRRAGIPSVTRQRVLDAAAKLDYHASAPARQLASGKSGNVGFVWRRTREQVGRDALPETLLGLIEAVRTAGHRVLVDVLEFDDQGYSDMLRSGQVDGLVVGGPGFDVDDPELTELVRLGYPIVVAGSRPPTPIPSVDLDTTNGAIRAVELLLELGHHRIAYINDGADGSALGAERLTGYRAALEAADIRFDPTLIVAGVTDARSGRQALLALLTGDGRPDAVVVASDIVASRVMSLLRQLGLGVPADVSIVALGDRDVLAALHPPLTSVARPAQDLGRAAGDAVLRRIAGRPVALRTLLAARVIPRSSTAQWVTAGKSSGHDAMSPSPTAM